MRGILPLLESKLDLPWCGLVTATDASGTGMGVCEKHVDPSVAGQHGRVSEKLRFVTEDFVQARQRSLLLRSFPARHMRMALLATASFRGR